MKILITGIAGTGKSTIVKALNERGVVAIDLHDVSGLFFWQDKKTREKVEYSPIHSHDWFDSVERLCDIPKLKELLARDENIVMAGTGGDSQAEYLPLFDKVILLQADPAILVHRMQTRINKSGYGKTKAEQDNNIEWQKEFDPELLSLGAVPINTAGKLDDVVDKILSEIGFHGVKIAILVDGKLLMHLRDNTPGLFNANMWDFPGGGREGTETPRECAIREVQEEFGIGLPLESFVWEKVYPAQKDPSQKAVFMVASVSREKLDKIQLTEGQRWDLFGQETFFTKEDVIPALKMRFKDYVDGVK